MLSHSPGAWPHHGFHIPDVMGKIHCVTARRNRPIPQSVRTRNPRTMYPRIFQVLTLITAWLLAPHAARAETPLSLAGVFTDHMVLQRDQAVPVWGWAAPADEVTVEFAGQKKAARADAEGKWMLKLDPLKASMEPQKMGIARGADALVFEDVLVDDVWLSSGQSNMHFPMSGVENSREEIAAADHPTMRFFTVESQFGQAPKADAQGTWKPVSPTTAAGCSAVAYYFARELL